MITSVHIHFSRTDSLEFSNSCFSSILPDEHTASGSVDQISSNFIIELLLKFPDGICDKIGLAKVFPYKIELLDSIPAFRRPFPCPPDKQRVLRSVIDDLLEKGVIFKSSSQYSAPCFLQPKKEPNSYRLLCDYIQTNKHIVGDMHPLPTIDQVFQYLSKA